MNFSIEFTSEATTAGKKALKTPILTVLITSQWHMRHMYLCVKWDQFVYLMSKNMKHTAKITMEADDNNFCVNQSEKKFNFPFRLPSNEVSIVFQILKWKYFLNQSQYECLICINSGCCFWNIFPIRKW